MTQRLKNFVEAFEREWRKRFASPKKNVKSEPPSNKKTSPPSGRMLDAAKPKREA